MFDRHMCPTCGPGETASLSDSPPAVRCKRCGLGYELTVSRDPTTDYDEGSYDVNRDRGLAEKTRWQRFHHDCNVAFCRLNQLSQVIGLPPTDRPSPWVDMGTNNGAFLVVARRCGWPVVGVEADETSARKLQELFGVTSFSFGHWVREVTRSPKMPMRVLSCFDVLEHVLDPTVVVMAALMLDPGGFFVVEAPDLDAAGDFATWHHRRVTDNFVEHQWHFCQSALEAMVANYAGPRLKLAHVARPVPGKIQMAWRAQEEAPHNGDLNNNDLRQALEQLDPEQRRQAIAVLKQSMPADAVDRLIAELGPFHDEQAVVRQ